MSKDSKSPELRETDWGVPLLGELLPRAQWSDTHLKRLPLDRFDVEKVFGTATPLVVDLGCGNGRFAIQSALQRPDYNHFAIDIFPGAIRHAVKRANRRGLKNVRFAVANADDLVRRLLPDQSVAELHVYHPQPVYDLAQAHQRLLTPSFLVQVHRVLKEDGLFVLQTDHPAYRAYFCKTVPFFFDVTEHSEPWQDAPLGRTRREILARQSDLPVFRMLCRPKPGVDIAAAREQAKQMPLPRFDADRRLQQLDKKEKIESD
jgi:tRNA (guanine-N7-)-methyltransferase